MGYYQVQGVNDHSATVRNHLTGFSYSLAKAKETNSNVRVLFPFMQSANSTFLAEAIGPEAAAKLCDSRAKKIKIDGVDFSASWIGSVKSRRSFNEIVYLVISPQLVEIEPLTKVLGSGIEMIVIEHHAEPGELKRWASDVKAKKI